VGSKIDLTFREIVRTFVRCEGDLIGFALSRRFSNGTAYRIRRFLRIEKTCFDFMLKKGTGQFSSRRTRDAILAVMDFRDEKDRTEADDIMKAMVAAQWNLAAHLKNKRKYGAINY